MPDNRSENGDTSGTFVADRVAGLLDSMPGLLKGEGFERIVAALTTGGHWGLLALAVLGFIVELIVAFAGGGTAIFWGIGWLIVLPLLQYTAVQFMGATRSMVTSNSTSLGSEVFLRCYSLVALVGAIVALIGAVVMGIDSGSFQVFLTGLAVTVLWLATAWLALNPSLLGIRVDTGMNAGEEAIGVLSFFVKSGVRIVPIFYGVTMIVGAVGALILLLGMIGDSRAELMGAVAWAHLMAPVVILAALSPFLAYIAFVFYFLAIDLMRSILAIPSGLSGSGGSRSGGSRSSGRSSRGGSRSGGSRTSRRSSSAGTSGASGSSGTSSSSGGEDESGEA